MAIETYTVVGWSVILGVIAVAVYYNNQEFFKRLSSPPTKVAVFTNQETKPSKKSRQKALNAIKQNKVVQETSVKSNDADNKGVLAAVKVNGNVAIKVNGNVTAQTVNGSKTSIARDEDGSMSNKAFALELQRAQSGTNLQKKTEPVAKSAKRKRTQADLPARLAGPANQNAGNVPPVPTENSSTTGMDGDDDITPASSPRSDPVSTAATSREGDVTDMLEPTPSGPKMLSIVNVEAKKQKTKPKPAEFEVAENKKQRQRRLKKEQQKEAVLQSNATHDMKKQQQMRLARMSEGTSKQTKANSFTSPLPNAWNKVSQHQNGSAQSAAPPPLLDTFDPQLDAKNVSEGAVSTKPLSNITNQSQISTAGQAKDLIGEPKVNALAASKREAAPELTRNQSWADEMSEEDLRARGILDPAEPEPEPEWQDVVSKKGKKRSANGDGDAKSDVSTRRENSQIRSRAKDVPNGSTVRPQSTNRFKSFETSA